LKDGNDAAAAVTERLLSPDHVVFVIVALVQFDFVPNIGGD